MISRWTNLIKNIAAANLASANFPILPSPFKLTFVVTKECHSRCGHCNIWKTKRSPEELTLEEIEKVASSIPSLSWVDFTGGEPTDRKDFVQIVEAFLKHCPNLLLTHFPTNGLKTKRIEGICRELVSLSPPRLVVTVSIDGPPEIHDKIRGIPGGYARSVETLSCLRQIPGLEAFAGMTLTEDNSKEIEGTYSSLKSIIPDFRYSELHLNLPHCSSHFYQNNESAPRTTSQMISAINEHKTRRGFPLSPFSALEWMYQKEVKNYLDTKLCPMPCSALLSSCFMSETGSVYPCSIWDAPLGNVRETNYSLLCLVKGTEAEQLRNSIRSKDCPNCWSPCEAYPTIMSNLIKPKSWRF